MLGSSKNKEKNVSNAPSGTSSHSLNSLVQGSTVEGTIRAKSDIRIDGTIKGKLFCESKVIIGPTGFVDGEIKCSNAVIEGRFNGQLSVSELLTIKEKAKIDGDVATDKLIVHSGAEFNVSCTMGSGSKNIQSSTNKEQNIVKTGKASGA